MSLAVAALICVVIAVVAIPGRNNGIPACRALSAALVSHALGLDVATGTADVPDGGEPGATMCTYGRPAGPEVTVFAFRQGGNRYFGQAKAALLAQGDQLVDASGPEYQAFVWLDPNYQGASLQSLTLVKHSQYVSVELRDAPTGAAWRLAPLVAAGLP